MSVEAELQPSIRWIREAVEEVASEHGGDAESTAFCHRAGLDYVLCSPFRLPVARLAAAHAALDVMGPSASA